MEFCFLGIPPFNWSEKQHKLWNINDPAAVNLQLCRMLNASKCVWSLELLTFQSFVFAKKRRTSLLFLEFFQYPAENQQRQTKTESAHVSISSSGNPSRPFCSASSPACSSPGAVMSCNYFSSNNVDPERPNGDLLGLVWFQAYSSHKNPTCWRDNHYPFLYYKLKAVRHGKGTNRREDN